MNQLADPTALLWLCLIGMGVLFFVKEQRMSGLLTLLLALVMWGLEFGQVPALLLARLEQPYIVSAKAEFPKKSVVVVLGGLGAASKHEVTGTDFLLAADRLLTGLHLARELGSTDLVLGGSGPAGSADNADGAAQAKWIRSWRLTSAEVRVLPSSRNTRDEAVYAAELAKEQKWERVILVTSAWHLRRAAAAFQKAGLQVDPVGCDFQGTTAMSAGRYWAPQTESLVHLKLWLHETIGWYYYKVRGWI